MASLWLEAHRRTIAATIVFILVVGTGGVPRKTQNHRSIAAVIVGRVLQVLSNFVVHLLIIFLRGNFGAGCLTINEVLNVILHNKSSRGSRRNQCRHNGGDAGI